MANPIHEPSTAEVRAALDRILGSHLFRASPKLAAFLRLVVEARLCNEARPIKAYTIGVEALGRAEDFDPNTDPIVRVEATRVRRAIGQYYTGAGATDPLIIDLPKGAYIPLFRRRALPLMPVAEPVCDGRLSKGNGMATITVEPIETAVAFEHSRVMLTKLPQWLRDAFVRFDTINVAAERSSEVEQSRQTVDYRLIGAAEGRSNGAMSLVFRLLDAEDGIAIWSRSFDEIDVSAGYDTIQDGIVREIAVALLGGLGIIRARDHAKFLAGKKFDPRYQCMLLCYHAYRTYDPTDHAAMRARLEEVLARDPTFSTGAAALAFIYWREYVYGFGSASDDPELLERAFAMASRAVELRPDNAHAYHALFMVHYARGDVSAAFAAAERALALNPFDVMAPCEYGGRLISMGQIDRGLEMIRRTAISGIIRYPGHHFWLFLGYYLKGDLDAAVRHAAQLKINTYPLGLMARVLAYAAINDEPRMAESRDLLIKLDPGWREAPRKRLARVFQAGRTLDRIERDLQAVGLGKSKPHGIGGTPILTARTTGDHAGDAAGNGMPVLVIADLKPTGVQDGPSVTGRCLTEKLRDAFSRFETINVVCDSPSYRVPDYRLEGAVGRRGNGLTSLRLRLLDNSRQSIIWSQTFDRVARSSDDTSRQNAMVAEIATRLLEPYGVIHAHDRASHLVSAAGDPRYRSVIEVAEVMRCFDPLAHARARERLEQLLVLEPSFSLGFSCLAQLHIWEFEHVENSRQCDAPPLDRALHALRRAIELNPESARAYKVLSALQVVRGDLCASVAAAEKAAALNCYDLSLLENYACRLIRMGQVDRGLAILNETRGASAFRQPWDHFWLFVGYYLKGDLDQASSHIAHMADLGRVSVMARLLLAASKGEDESLRRELAAQLTPELREGLVRCFPAGPHRDRLLHDLDEAISLVRA